MTFTNIVFHVVLKQCGRDTIRVTTQINLNKPKCWVEGHEYKFNSKIVEIRVVKSEKYK